MNLTNCAVIVMDVADPNLIKYYNREKNTNDCFVKYLNCRLIDLKKQGITLIECNYTGNTHPFIEVDFDYKTILIEDLKKFLEAKNINKVVYTGFHYDICTHIARETSSVYLLEQTNLEVYVSPFLCRPIITDQWKIPKTWYFEVPIIKL